MAIRPGNASASAAAGRQQQRLRPDRQFRRTLRRAAMRQRQQQRAQPHRGHLALQPLDHHRHDVGVADEVGDEMAVRLLVQSARRAVLRDPRHAHHHDAVGDRQRLLLVVRHVHRGERQALLQLADLLAHMAAQLGIEIGQRLVEQQHLRLQHDRPRHRDALLLAAGQFARQARAVAGQARPASASPAPARPPGPCASPRRAGRNRRSPAPSCAETARTTGTPSTRRVRPPTAASHRRRRSGSGRRSPAPARRSAAGSSSCRSRTARAASPACRVRSRS